MVAQPAAELRTEPSLGSTENTGEQEIGGKQQYPECAPGTGERPRRWVVYSLLLKPNLPAIFLHPDVGLPGSQRRGTRVGDEGNLDRGIGQGTRPLGNSHGTMVAR